MKKNLDQILIKFLKSKEKYSLVLLDEDLFRIDFNKDQLFVQSQNEDISCSLGNFAKVSNFIYKIEYRLPVYQLIKNKSSKNDFIQLLNSLYSRDQVNEKLVEYLEAPASSRDGRI